jgi:hypothetical protein
MDEDLPSSALVSFGTSPGILVLFVRRHATKTIVARGFDVGV